MNKENKFTDCIVIYMYIYLKEDKGQVLNCKKLDKLQGRAIRTICYDKQSADGRRV